MKTRIATALSVVGVLGAGSAAALVNTQILDGAPAESSASAAVLPPASTIDVSIPTVPDTSLPPDTTVEPPTPSTEPSAPATTEPPVPAATGFLTAFNVGEAGVVTVDVIDGRIILISAEAKAGWDVTKTEQPDDDNEIEVYFRSGTTEVEFEAALIDGQIVPKVSSRTLGGASDPASVPSDTTAGNHDDDHDDEYDDHDDDDDDHDDEHDDDEQDDDEQDDDEHDDDEHDERDDD